MDTGEFFAYSWHIDEDEKSYTIIRIYGLNNKNETVCVCVKNFTPYVYVELPEDINWDDSKANCVVSKINTLMETPEGDYRPIKAQLMFKKRLYFAELNSKMERKLFPYLCLTFQHSDHIQKFTRKMWRPLYITSIANKPIQFKIHEHNANPVLQLTSLRKLPTAGWIKFSGKKVKPDDQHSRCPYEYNVKWKDLEPKASDIVARPYLLSFDIEVYSHRSSVMPDPAESADEIFQISCIFSRQGSKQYEKYLLTLGEPDEKACGEDVKVITYAIESDLLDGFVDLIQEKQPNIIMGYNIFGFDLPHMLARAENIGACKFKKQGFNRYGDAKEKVIEWSSSAYKNQSFRFLDAEGRLYFDLLPQVRRLIKLSSYSLKAISSHVLKNATKDPLDAKGIFKCYEIGIKKNRVAVVPSEKSRRAVSLVGKYCVQDSVLVTQLFETLTMWIALCEMSKVTGVPIFSLYTQGQQLKAFSQVYRKCTHENIVVEKDAYKTQDNDHYVGAIVFVPEPGIYEKVVSFDFCLGGSTLIASSNGCSQRIDQLVDSSVWSKDDKGLVQKQTVNGLQVKGEKETVKIWLQDGTTIVSTPDHKFMLDDGSWVEAKDLKDKYVCSGLENPEDVKCELESKWSFRVGDIQLNMKKNREKSLAFARMIGFILTDGSIYRSKNRKCIEAYFGTNIDATIFNHDMELLCGRTTTISRRLTDPNTARGVKGNTFRITLPASLAKDIHSIDGIVVGKRSTQAMMLPSFLLDKNCPLAIIREFLGGLFGGDGVAPCLSNGRFGRISFKWTTIEKHKSSMQNVFEQIALLLQRFGLETILHTPTKVKYGPNSIQPKDSDENPRWDYQISISSNDILKFQTCIGFRYCVNKSYRLTIVSSYQRMTELTRQQHADVLKQTLERSKTSTVPKALEESRKNVFLEQPVINEYSLSSVRDVYYQRHEQIRHADKPRKLSLQPKKFPSLKSYLIETNTLHWFGRKTYSVGPLDTHIPTYRRKVIDVRPNGIEKVYDIEVTDTHNFLANGVVAHNCSLYPTTIIAYNICWSTLVRDDKVPDDLCHIMEWEDHIGCVHDPKEIRKAEITKQLKVKEDELKEVRRQKALKTNKNRQEELKMKIDEMVEEVKPLRQERSQLMKSKGKHIICAKRRYRWVKSPKGVLPEILSNLLDTRASTKKEMKKVKSEIDKIPDDDSNKQELTTYYDVLDQRQLELKVSANSGYGCMGVRRGYLPFMPGAMCTTYMGRIAIEKAAKTIQHDYKGKLIYGDTDSNYVSFPHLSSVQDCWDYSVKVANEVTKLYPRPMSLAFEEKIFMKFLIITKKRYMCLACKRDGKVDEKISNKGVLLTRRDSCPFIRKVYSEVVMMIFNRADHQAITQYVLEELNKLCSHFYPTDQFVITKSVGDIGDLIPQPGKDKNDKDCYKVGDYKVTLLPEDKSKREKKFELKDCDNEHDYYLRCMPAQVQLAEKIRQRGQLVPAGTRLEYVITDRCGHLANQSDKVEGFDYFVRHSDSLKIDYLYYLKLLTKPLDQILDIIFTNPKEKGFVLKQYKYRLQVRKKVIDTIQSLSAPKLKFA